MAPLLCKEEMLSHNSLKMWSVLFYSQDYGWYLFRVKGILAYFFVDLVQMLLPGHMVQGTEINLKQQSKVNTQLIYSLTLMSLAFCKTQIPLRVPEKIKRVFNPKS